MSAGARRPGWWPLVPLLLLSVAVGWYLIQGSGPEPAAVWWVLQYFYFPGRVLSLMLMGGFHGAPDWAVPASAYLGVLAQNLLLWWVWRRWLRPQLLQRWRTGR